jgi:hypothetical protein
LCCWFFYEVRLRRSRLPETSRNAGTHAGMQQVNLGSLPAARVVVLRMWSMGFGPFCYVYDLFSEQMSQKATNPPLHASRPCEPL